MAKSIYYLEWLTHGISEFDGTLSLFLLYGTYYVILDFN